MASSSRYRSAVSSLILPVSVPVLAMAIFLLDTVTGREIAVSVFYVVVVLISVFLAQWRGVLAVSAGCMALTLLSHVLSTGPENIGLVNTVISLAAIAATTFLALRIKSTERAMLDAQAQLAHIARVTTLGELTASIAHEVNQPLAAVVTNGNACSRWLAAEPPNLEEAREAVDRIVRDAHRASEVVGRIRTLAKRGPPQKEWLSINETILDVVGLMRGDLQRERIALRTALSVDLPLVFADRIQLQQVLINLIFNAIEAMSEREGSRDLVISSTHDKAEGALVAVHDSGKGLTPNEAERVFDPFHSTKPQGMGMGLAISRSIVEAHGGRIWAAPNSPRGAVFRLTIPTTPEQAA